MMNLFEVGSPVPLKADIVVEGDGFRSEEAAQVPADVTFRCHINVFAPLMCGRILGACLRINVLNDIRLYQS